MAIGDPTGDDLCVGTTNGETLPTFGSWEEREITFGAGVELTSGVKYAVVVRALTSPLGAAVNWVQANGNPYANGGRQTSVNGGTSWTSVGVYDTWFKTKAAAVEKDTNTFVTTTFNTEIYGDVWVAQSFTASSTYTITSVILKMARWAVGATGTVTVSIKATVAVPIKAKTPAPADAADTVTLDQATLTWEDGGGATSYNVYYGDTSGDLELVSEGQAETSFTISGIDLGSPFDYTKTRYWRIDSINDMGTTTGDEWSFTTITFNAPAAGGRGGTDGASGGTISDGQSNIKTRLVAFANNKVWYEDI